MFRQRRVERLHARGAVAHHGPRGHLLAAARAEATRRGRCWPRRPRASPRRRSPRRTRSARTAGAARSGAPRGHREVRARERAQALLRLEERGARPVDYIDTAAAIGRSPGPRIRAAERSFVEVVDHDHRRAEAVGADEVLELGRRDDPPFTARVRGARRACAAGACPPSARARTFASMGSALMTASIANSRRPMTSSSLARQVDARGEAVARGAGRR